jgi:hypothetical protein
MADTISATPTNGPAPPLPYKTYSRPDGTCPPGFFWAVDPTSKDPFPYYCTPNPGTMPAISAQPVVGTNPILPLPPSGNCPSGYHLGQDPGAGSSQENVPFVCLKNPPFNDAPCPVGQSKQANPGGGSAEFVCLPDHPLAPVSNSKPTTACTPGSSWQRGGPGEPSWVCIPDPTIPAVSSSKPTTPCPPGQSWQRGGPGEPSWTCIPDPTIPVAPIVPPVIARTPPVTTTMGTLPTPVRPIVPPVVMHPPVITIPMVPTPTPRPSTDCPPGQSYQAVPDSREFACVSNNPLTPTMAPTPTRLPSMGTGDSTPGHGGTGDSTPGRGGTGDTTPGVTTGVGDMTGGMTTHTGDSTPGSKSTPPGSCPPGQTYRAASIIPLPPSGNCPSGYRLGPDPNAGPSQENVPFVCLSEPACVPDNRRTAGDCPPGQSYQAVDDSREFACVPDMPTTPMRPGRPTIPTMPTMPTLPMMPTMPVMPTLPTLPTMPTTPLSNQGGTGGLGTTGGPSTSGGLGTPGGLGGLGSPGGTTPVYHGDMMPPRTVMPTMSMRPIGGPGTCFPTPRGNNGQVLTQTPGPAPGCCPGYPLYSSPASVSPWLGMAGGSPGPSAQLSPTVFAAGAASTSSSTLGTVALWTAFGVGAWAGWKVVKRKLR